MYDYFCSIITFCNVTTFIYLLQTAFRGKCKSKQAKQVIKEKKKRRMHYGKELEIWRGSKSNHGW